MLKNKLKVLVISDGTGQTAQDLLRAVSLQFKDQFIEVSIKKYIKDSKELKLAIVEASIHHNLIAYTLVDKKLRDFILEDKTDIEKIDLLGPVLNFFGSFLNTSPKYEAGLSRNIVDDNYYQKISALEFTLKNDERISPKAISRADLILLGISRTSKTPLSIFLSLRGYKVLNFKISIDNPLPKEVFSYDQKKIIALTINAETLFNIRRNRVDNDESQVITNYQNPDSIKKELEHSDQLFHNNPTWPVFDVTDKSLEEISTEIIRFLAQRESREEKIKQRFK